MYTTMVKNIFPNVLLKLKSSLKKMKLQVHLDEMTAYVLLPKCLQSINKFFIS